MAGVAIGCTAAYLGLNTTDITTSANATPRSAGAEASFASRILELPPPAAGVPVGTAAATSTVILPTEPVPADAGGSAPTQSVPVATPAVGTPPIETDGLVSNDAGQTVPAPLATPQSPADEPAGEDLRSAVDGIAVVTPDAGVVANASATTPGALSVAAQSDPATRASMSSAADATGSALETTASAAPTASAAAMVIGFGPGSAPGSVREPIRSETRSAPPSPFRTVKVKVRKGDSLYSILRARGISGSVVPALLSGGDHGKRLQLLRPGQGLDLHLDAAGSLARMDYRIDALTTVSYRRDESGFDSALTTLELERRKAHTTGSITSSLFLDGRRAGLTDRQVMQIAEIFGWDVDFAHDIRKGDRFTVVYEELLHKGKLIRSGDILAAEFVNRGKVLRAVRFVDPKGRAQYFTPEGLGMRKAFLRSPVKFGRISSRFNLRRRHPVLHKIRAHRGVDYAARRGTPIMATGEARVEFVGGKRGYGKTIVLRHAGGNYTTLYAHMQKFARGMRAGKSVRQGEVIGYVGSSGLATGPHVHYEFRVRGNHKDPLKVKLPKSLPISPKLRRAFRNQTHKLIAMLDVYSTTSVAMR